MKLLVIGANGQVGSELCLLNTKSCEIIGLDRAGLDITEPGKIEDAVLKTQPDFVINASAYTAVDKAEQEIDVAYAVNRDGPMFLARSCAEHNIPLIHISTDYVFGGDASVPYKEDDITRPINVYGKSKLDGEERVRQLCPEHIILRTSWVFGRHGNNFVKTMLRLAETKTELSVVNDQHGNPTAAKDIAATIIKLCDVLTQNRANDKLWGTYHFSGKPATNWHDFAESIFTIAEKYGVKAPQVKAIPSSSYPTPAKRPQYTVLNCDKIRQDFGIETPDWHDGLVDLINSLVSV